MIRDQQRSSHLVLTSVLWTYGASPEWYVILVFEKRILSYV